MSYLKRVAGLGLLVVFLTACNPTNTVQPRNAGMQKVETTISADGEMIAAQRGDV